MKNQKKGIRKIGILILIGTFGLSAIQSRITAQDMWCINRVTIDNTTSRTQLSVVNNPLMEAGGNISDKVLKLTDVDQRGTIAINLTRRIGSAKDQIFDISQYNAIRFKYCIVNPPYSSYNMRLKMDGNGSVIYPAMSNTNRNWKVATFSFPKNSTASWIQLSTYYVTQGNWNDSFSGMEIYLDDIELLNTDSPNAIQENELEKTNVHVNGKELSVSDIPDNTDISVSDLQGQIIYRNIRVSENYFMYNFSVSGFYILSMQHQGKTISHKRIVK